MSKRTQYLLIAAVLLTLSVLLYVGLNVVPARAAWADRTTSPGDLTTGSERLMLGQPSMAATEVCTPDAANMVAYWPFDDGASAPPYVDLIGSHDATCAGTCPSSTTGIINNAVQFFGDTLANTGNPLSVSSFEGINWQNTDSFSIEAWVNITDTCDENKVFVGRRGAGVYSWWLGCAESTNFAELSIRDHDLVEVSVTGTTPLNDGSWHHVVGVRDEPNSQILLYVDGNLEDSEAEAFTGYFWGPQSLNIGYLKVNVGTNYYLKGSLDEVAIYNGALSADEISDHYSGGTGQSYCNDAPVVTNPGDKTNSEGDVIVSLPIVASDSDGDPLTFTATQLPPGLSINSGTGEISGTVSFLAYKGSTYAVEVTVSDDNTPAGVTKINFNWTINDVNRAPVATDVEDQSDAEGDVITLPIAATDSDSDNSLTYSASGLPDGLSIDPGTGVISGTISQTAAANSPYTTVVTVTDDAPSLLSDVVTFTWDVSEVNMPPDVTNPGTQVSKEYDSIELQIEASDLDGNTLAYSATNLPAGLSIDANSGLISGQLAANSAGEYLVQVTVSDGQNPEVIAFDWTVYPNHLFVPVVTKNY